MHLLPSLGLLFLAGAAASPLLAKPDEQPYAPPPPTITATPLAMAIAAFDADGDLQVTRVEYDKAVAAAFAKADADGDGGLSLFELSDWSRAMLGNANALPGRFDFDRDGDDKVSKREFTVEFAGRFLALDKDSDSSLQRSELVILVQSPIDPRRGRGRASPPAQPQRR